MARPSPRILAEASSTRSLNPASVHQVLAQSDALYVVTYDEQPFQYRINTKGKMKYVRTAYTYFTSAKNVCANLNQQFNTTLFKVIKVTFKPTHQPK